MDEFNKPSINYSKNDEYTISSTILPTGVGTMYEERAKIAMTKSTEDLYKQIESLNYEPVFEFSQKIIYKNYESIQIFVIGKRK